jgi:hypothetical protein
MHDQEKSDSAIVAVKSPNKTGFPVAEAMERRAGTKGNADQHSMHRTQIRARATQALGAYGKPISASPSNTQGRSRMLESGSSGSVREVLSNAHSYREPRPRADDSYLSGNRRDNSVRNCQLGEPFGLTAL